MPTGDETIRDQVRRAVAERVAIDQDERDSIDRVLTEFERLEDPFDEHADLVHVTGSAIVIGPRGVVLLKHKRLGLWLQPGGHLDAGETPWDAALREAAEETGLEVSFVDRRDGATPDLIHVDVHAGGRGHTHLDLRYLVNGGHADPSPPVGESQEVGWFAWPEAIKVASDSRLAALLTFMSR